MQRRREQQTLPGKGARRKGKRGRRGRSKGNNLADSLVDNDFDELKDLAGSKLSKAKGAVLGASESE